VKPVKWEAKTGFVNLNRFTGNSGGEVAEAFAQSMQIRADDRRGSTCRTAAEFSSRPSISPICS
jgi:hypothetical protein